jgi:hypothetical protein
MKVYTRFYPKKDETLSSYYYREICLWVYTMVIPAGVEPAFAT